MLKVNDSIDKSLLMKAIDRSGVGVTISNQTLPDEPLIYINEGFENLTGYSREEVLRTNCRFLQGSNKNQEAIKEMRKAINEEKSCEVELLNYKKNGEEFWNEVHLTPIFNKEGTLEYYIGIQKDITARKRAEESMRLYEKVFLNTLQGVMITDSLSKIILVNQAFTETTGYTFEDVQGENPRLLSSGKQPKPFYFQLWKELREKGQWQGEIWNKRKNGEIYPQFLNISAVEDNNDQVTNYVAIFTDITESKNKEKQLSLLSSQDSLTGIANRRTFDQYIHNMWNTLSNIHEPLSLIMIDIDFFKLYNDTYGHYAGDDCLIKVAGTLEDSVRSMDLVARYGGEEFAVVLPQCSLQVAKEIAESIRQNIELNQIKHEQSSASPVVTVSVGVTSLIPGEEWSVVDLINQADKALYSAKSLGRNRVEVY